MKIVIMAAVSENRVIGINNLIPWNIPAELEFFKETTLEHPVIMGRKTFDSLNGALEQRLNIILSRTVNNGSESSDNIVFTNSLEQAVKIAESRTEDRAYIIGGEDVFNQSLERADEMIISKIAGIYKGDAHFPNIDERKWELVRIEDKDQFKVEYYCRK